MNKFSQRSLDNLVGVHPDLIKVMSVSLSKSPIDFGIIEGLRTEARQKEMLASGASQTLNSRHLTGHAVDFIAYVYGKGTWESKYYYQIASIIKKVAKDLNIPVIWGGDWTTLKDSDHFELDSHTYP